MICLLLLNISETIYKYKSELFPLWTYFKISSVFILDSFKVHFILNSLNKFPKKNKILHMTSTCIKSHKNTFQIKLLKSTFLTTHKYFTQYKTSLS